MDRFRDDLSTQSASLTALRPDSKPVVLSLTLSPQGRLLVETDRQDAQTASESSTADRIVAAFLDGNAAGILHLAGSELTENIPDSLVYWRDFGRLFLAHLCSVPDLEETRKNIVLTPPPDELAAHVVAAPPMRGSEYLSNELLTGLWLELVSAIQERLNKYKGTIEEFLHSINPAWNLVGRVCFHLAENKQSPDQPFAFLATYASRLSAKARPQHLPLGRAIQQYSGAGNKNALLTLLKPVQRAAATSQLLKAMVEAGEIFHPLAWTPEDAFQFLKDIPVFEAAGILVRVPDWWKAKRPPRPEVKVTVGKKGPSGLGLNALMDFNVSLSLEGEEISKAEWHKILESTSGLVSIKGRWVEIDQEKLKEVLQHWQDVQESVAEDGVSFGAAMRLLAGASQLGSEKAAVGPATQETEWCRVVAGDWLAMTLQELRNPANKDEFEIDADLRATLRPYQKNGVKWLWLLHRLGLGACLADDMGLGKTVQILALLLMLKRQQKKSHTILVMPASLIGNWLSEAEKFAPSLTFFVLHPSCMPEGMADTVQRQRATGADVTVTTYGLLTRYPWLTDTKWTLAVLDEAQAIKNPGAKQTVAVKALKAGHRIVLTGTPVENRLSDLWSLFDFICPGLLGGGKAFNQFVKAKETQKESPYTAIRNLVRPYILRRLKIDRSVISDLPDKSEIRVHCSLSKTQAGLYALAVTDLAKRIDEVEGIQRRGVILSFLMRLKQICNHPSQWLGDGFYEPKASGKFQRLGEICEEIAARQDKALIFTQFREMTEPLAGYLAGIFGKQGLILHGGTPVKERKSLVDRFQGDSGPPFFILSLKAGGTGLNLTAASHVIHFDRWWNPAVENQATDRAFRIGQKRNVLVHKFVCKGTIEEKIDALIESKKAMASELLEGGSETLLTEMSNDELLKMVSLDIKSATENG